MLSQSSNEYIIHLTKNYEPKTETKVLLDKLYPNIIENIQFFISLNYNKSIQFLIEKLSPLDQKILFDSKISVFFKIKTINSLIKETIEDEKEYEQKILNHLSIVKLGESGKGTTTGEILSNIGGNATSLRNKLISLEERGLVCGLGKTISKTWVIGSLAKEAKKKEKQELGIK